MTVVPRFHPAFPVRDLDETRAFYGDLLECNEGRSSAEWVDFDFSGHRIAAHLSAGFGRAEEPNSTGDAKISGRHFGIVLDTEKWRILPAKFRKARVPFPVEPGPRAGRAARGRAIVFPAGRDGNGPGFKAFARQEQGFAH